ncbi:ribosomal RNA processing protein 36 homolog [Lutzomyia longipalpis]|uniref:ribosomal RNA processing protein 36 homolog n=1 Tax=Lutzomyia longipalpis TaxID=7200 RepID=UPI002483653F|nr:ribosomal RNA processing protein 36 homolog [Lutzomyia longipalpis]
MSDSEEDIKDSSSDEEAEETKDDSDPEKEAIKEELKNMPFEELIKLKKKLGAKVYNSTVLGINKKTESVKKDFKRENKNRPREMSFRKPIVERQRKKSEIIRPRDPRFDAKCGEFSRSEFKKRFSFVDEMRMKEIAELKESLKKTEDPEEKKKIKGLIQRLDNQVREASKMKEKEERDKSEIQNIQKARDEGKTPIYTNKKQQKLKNLVEQYKDLKQSGKLQKHIEKRRKKNASRDRKKMNRIK